MGLIHLGLHMERSKDSRVDTVLNVKGGFARTHPSAQH